MTEQTNHSLLWVAHNAKLDSQKSPLENGMKTKQSVYISQCLRP